MAKRIINLAISMLVAVYDWLQARARMIAGRKPRKKCIVLAYHSVSDTQRAQFASQMDMLIQNAEPVRAGINALPTNGENYACVTFDDGFQNIVDNALPELSKRGIHATLFVVTESLGGNRGWEHLGGDDTSQEKVMSVEQLREVSSELVTIGSHTMTHPMLPSIGKTQLMQELSGSRVSLQQILNREIDLLSFPYGGFNDAVVEGCREAGYKRVFTALPAFAFSQPSEFVSGRVGAAPTDWPIEFRLKLAGTFRWLPYAYALKRRIRSILGGRALKSVQIKTEEKRIA
jgi:peptidoglycan/xylan/chitin deacetylase (PgdA/CDA1 family)